MESRDEYMVCSLKFDRELSCDEILKTLNEHSFAGINFLSITPFSGNKISFRQKEVSRIYRLKFSSEEMASKFLKKNSKNIEIVEKSSDKEIVFKVLKNRYSVAKPRDLYSFGVLSIELLKREFETEIN